MFFDFSTPGEVGQLTCFLSCLINDTLGRKLHFDYLARMTESTVINMSPYLFLLNLFCSNTILADLTEWSFYGKPRMVTLSTDMNIHEEMIAYLSIGIWLYFVTKIDLIIDDSFRVSLFINFGCLQDLEGAFWHFYDKWTYFTGQWLMEI